MHSILDGSGDDGGGFAWLTWTGCPTFPSLIPMGGLAAAIALICLLLYTAICLYSSLL